MEAIIVPLLWAAFMVVLVWLVLAHTSSGSPPGAD